MKLKERLAAIAAMVPQGSRLADIGTDHCYLPIYLLESDRITFAVAGDVHRGPYQVAQEAVKSLDLTDKISVRLGNGLAVLTPGEVDTIVIAGMGGSTIVEILASSPTIVSAAGTLILQPMIGAALVRRWLIKNGWRISDETLVYEDGILYEIIMAEQGQAELPEEVLYDIGPLLWRKRNPLIKDHLERLIGQYRRIVTEMSASPQALASPKYREYADKLQQLEGKLSCL